MMQIIVITMRETQPLNKIDWKQNTKLKALLGTDT